MKNQVAELKAQLTAPENPQQWTGNTFSSKGSSAKFQNRQTKKDAKNQQRSSSVTSSSWSIQDEEILILIKQYVLDVGKMDNLASNCENDPNPSKVDEKKRQLSERQAQWDLKNQATADQLTGRQSL